MPDIHGTHGLSPGATMWHEQSSLSYRGKILIYVSSSYNASFQFSYFLATVREYSSTSA